MPNWPSPSVTPTTLVTIEQSSVLRACGRTTKGLRLERFAMFSSRMRPEVIAILGVVLIVAALWGAWAYQTPNLFMP